MKEKCACGMLNKFVYRGGARISGKGVHISLKVVCVCVWARGRFVDFISLNLHIL